LVAIVCALPLTAAHAQSLAFTLSTTTLSGTPGSTVTFQGVLSNTGSSTLFLNGIDIGTTDPNLPSIDFDPNVPFSLAAGDSYTGNIFGVVVSPSATAGVLNNTAIIQGGADSNATGMLGSQAFHVAVVVPETGTLALTLVGLVGGGIVLRRRRS